MTKGWMQDSARHSLARKGVKSKLPKVPSVGEKDFPKSQTLKKGFFSYAEGIVYFETDGKKQKFGTGKELIELIKKAYGTDTFIIKGHPRDEPVGVTGLMLLAPTAILEAIQKYYPKVQGWELIPEYELTEVKVEKGKSA